MWEKTTANFAAAFSRRGIVFAAGGRYNGNRPVLRQNYTQRSDFREEIPPLSKGAVLVAASYRNGRQTGVKTVSLGTKPIDGTVFHTGLSTVGSDLACKVMLLVGGTLAPLCPAWTGGT